MCVCVIADVLSCTTGVSWSACQASPTRLFLVNPPTLLILEHPTVSHSPSPCACPLHSHSFCECTDWRHRTCVVSLFELHPSPACFSTPVSTRCSSLPSSALLLVCLVHHLYACGFCCVLHPDMFVLAMCVRFDSAVVFCGVVLADLASPRALRVCIALSNLLPFIL